MSAVPYTSGFIFRFAVFFCSASTFEMLLSETYLDRTSLSHNTGTTDYLLSSQGHPSTFCWLDGLDHLVEKCPKMLGKANP